MKRIGRLEGRPQRSRIPTRIALLTSISVRYERVPGIASQL